MFKDFKLFLETVPFDPRKFRAIRKQLPNFRPGTFGVEIEFRHDANEQHENMRDNHEGWDDFHSEHAPEDLDDWDHENPEPELPEWSDDSVVNYNEVHGFSGNVMPQDDVYEILKKYEKADLFGFPGRRYYEFYYHRGHEFFNVDQKRVTFIIVDEPVHWKQWENKNRYRGIEIERLRNIMDDPEFAKALYAAEERYRKFHENRMDSLDQTEWEQEVEEKYDEARGAWLSDRSGVEEEWENWLQTRDEHYDDWIRGQIPSLKSKIVMVANEIKELGLPVFAGKSTDNRLWRVFKDSENDIEVTSPILTTKDIPALKQVIRLLRNEDFREDTGFHIHVGVPQLDVFERLVMFSQLDDLSMLQVARRDSEAVDNYAKLKDEFFMKLAEELDDSAKHGVLTFQELESEIDSLDRYYALNLTSFSEHGTVELRLMGSRVIHKPDLALHTINQMLILPRLAQNKQEIRNEHIRLVRAGNAVAYTITHGDQKQHQIRSTGYPASHQKADDVRAFPNNYPYVESRLKALEHWKNYSGDISEDSFVVIKNYLDYASKSTSWDHTTGHLQAALKRLIYLEKEINNPQFTREAMELQKIIYKELTRFKNIPDPYDLIRRYAN